MKNLLKKILGKQITIYRTCEEMPLWNYQKYLQTNELKYFTKELKEVKELQDVVVIFFDEYIELSNSTQARERLRIMNEIMRLSNKYDTVSLAIKAIYSYDTRLGIEILESHIDVLTKYRYKIDKNKPLFEQIEMISTRLNAIKTKIELLKPELESENNKEAESIESQIITASRILSLPYKINQKKTSVLEWIEIQKQCIEITEKIKASKNGK